MVSKNLVNCVVHLYGEYFSPQITHESFNSISSDLPKAARESVRRPQCTVAESGTSNSRGLFTTRKQAREKGKSCIYVFETSGSVHACMSETHGSCMFPCMKKAQRMFPASLKGFSYTHTQPVSVSNRHAKRCMRYVHILKQRLAYFSYT